MQGGRTVFATEVNGKFTHGRPFESHRPFTLNYNKFPGEEGAPQLMFTIFLITCYIGAEELSVQ